ncbi:MAG: hypothetical protein AAFV88_04000 [Planctomycetota bacterium]
MSDIRPIKLRRFQHRQGQSLLSDDLNDKFGDAAQRAWWHNRAAHDAYGVAFGYEATYKQSLTAVGNAVRVAPGIAYDHWGRELVLPEPMTIPLPSQSQVNCDRWALLIRYAEREDLPRTGVVCDGLRRSASPQFVWKPLRQISCDDGVLIIAVDFHKGEFQHNKSITPPRTNRLAAPRIARGATLIGKTAWRSVDTVDGDTVEAEWLVVTVDAEEHQFLDLRGKAFRSAVPHYLACIDGFVRDDIFLAATQTVRESSRGFDFVALVVRDLKGDAIRTNDLMKFGVLFDIARSMGRREESTDEKTMKATDLKQAPPEAAKVASLLEFAQRYLHVRWTGSQCLAPVAVENTKESQTEEIRQ